jgi:hypothetical protein
MNWKDLVVVQKQDKHPYLLSTIKKHVYVENNYKKSKFVFRDKMGRTFTATHLLFLKATKLATTSADKA